MTVTLDERRATVRFERYDLPAYGMFLRAKTTPETRVSYDHERDVYEISVPARFAGLLGVEGLAPAASRLDLDQSLFDFQRFIVNQALDAKRYAVWADTGLGKTRMFLEWARQVEAATGGRVLIFSPPSIIEQTRAEYRLVYGCDAVEAIRGREALAEWCERPGPGIGITNYEAMIRGELPELRSLAGLALDESSILKTGGGTIKWNLIHSSKGIEHKLSCTATPAPNEAMEYASQAAFLEKFRSEGEILWTFFSKDKRGNWHVKPHAQQAFYSFMASWSIYLRDPAAYGFADILATLPEPEIVEHVLAITEDQRAAMSGVLAVAGRGLFDERLGIRERSKLSQIEKGFLYGENARRVESVKPAAVASLANGDVQEGRQTLVWTEFDEESAILEEGFAGNHRGLVVGALHGSHTTEQREETIRRFKAGDLDVLVTKAQLVGYGMNFQNAKSMIFSGFSDSFERKYQAIRRAYRFGQTERVRVHFPYVPELVGLMLANLRQKEEAFMVDVALCERHYRDALSGELAVAA